MPTFDTPGPIAATVVVAGAQVRVTASDRTDTVVLVEPAQQADPQREYLWSLSTTFKMRA
jgi:hypothetical protein